MSTTPEHPQDPASGGYPPPPPGSAQAGSAQPAGGPPPRSTPPPSGSTPPSDQAPPSSSTPPGDAGYPPPPGYGPGGPGQGGYGQGGYGQGGTPGGYPPSAYGQAAPLSPSDQRALAVASHLGGMFVSFLVPLIVWLVFRSRGAYLEDQSKEALNFQITLFIGYAIGFVTFIIGIGLIIVPLVYLFGFVMAIIAAVAAAKGEPYRYPLTLRLIS